MHLDDVRHLYDRRAPFYDSLVWAMSLGRDGKYRDRAVRALQAEAGHRVLDVGCGTGLNFPKLPKGAVGIDPSTGILRVAKRRNPGLACASAEQLPFSDGHFDRVISTYVATTVPKWPRGIAEMARVLRTGGRLVVTDDRLPPCWFLGPGPMFRKIFREGWVDIHREVAKEMKKYCEEVKLSYLHFGLIYLIEGVKR